MKISKTLPQFDHRPALFVSSGEYEAKMYLVQDGTINLLKQLKLTPREQAKEKQGFTRSSSGKPVLTTFSHRGRYIDDLKKKFVRTVKALVQEYVVTYKLDEIYIFAPKYAAQRIITSLSKPQQHKVRMQFYKEYTKNNPLDLLRNYQKALAEMNTIAIKTPGFHPILP